MEAGESGVAVRRRIGIHRGKEGLIKGGRKGRIKKLSQRGQEDY